MSGNTINERRRKLIATNRKARHEFHIVQTLEAGVVLQGTEVKSLRAGRCSLQDAYAAFVDKNSNELILHNLHINPYEQGSFTNHEPKRPRKLLINVREARKLKPKVNEKGYTLIPLSLYFSGHLVKVELALVTAKKKYDKREAVKEREVQRDIRRKFAG